MREQLFSSEDLDRILQVVMARRESMPGWVRDVLPRRVARVSVEIATGYATIFYIDFDDQRTATIGEYLPPELIRELTA